MQKQTPEEQVLETLDRLSGMETSFCAVYVAMSRLSPENRGYRQLEIVSKLFEPLLTHAHSRLFLLSNHDFLLITANPSLESIDDVLYQIKSLFQDDVLISLQKASEFEQIFFLDQEMDRLKTLVEAHRQKAATDVQPPAVSPFVEAFTPDILEKILGALEHMDTLDFIRRQAVVKLSPQGPNKVFFHEYYTSILNLQKALCPSTDLLTEKALFHQLTETLDRRMLGALGHVSLYNYPPAISLNLNISTLSAPIFEKLAKNWPTRLIVEFQLSDIFTNLKGYHQAVQILHDKGHLVALDNITAPDFQYLDVLRLGADFVKLFWSPKWMQPEFERPLYALVKSNPKAGLILSRCGSEDALRWGQKMGLHYFQGRFIDAILAALTKNTCTFGQECTLSTCLICRSVLSGKLRQQCVHQRHLDAPLEIKVM